VVVVLLTAGDHTPAMFSLEEPGSVIVEPLHTGPIGSKVGVTCEVTVTVSCAVVAQVLPDGVNV
jgi:hypothetical protein